MPNATPSPVDRTTRHSARKRAPFCSYPWYFLGVNPESYQPCCYLTYRYERLPETRQDVAALFNSKDIRRLREKLAAHDVDNLRCKTCPMAGHLFPDFPGKTAPAFLTAEAEARAAYAAGDSRSPSPLMLHVIASHDCNLRCIMCHQRLYEIRPHAHIPRISEAAAKALCGGVGLEALGRINIAGGGELFFAPDGRGLLRALLDQGAGDTEVGIVTNGLLLLPYLKELARVERLELSVSVDGYGRAYEHIRAGGKWETLVRNLRGLALARRDKPFWRVNLLSLVMKSSLSSLEDLVRLACDLDFEIAFGKVLEPFFQENVFMFPDLLEGLPWREDFARAIAAALALGRPAVAVNLRALLGELEGCASGERPEMLISSDCEGNAALAALIEDNRARLAGRDVVLFGVSAKTFTALALLRGMGITVAAAADFDPALQGRRIQAVPIVAPEVLGKSVPVFLVALTCETKQYLRSKEFLAAKLPEVPVLALNAPRPAAAARIKALVRSLDGRPVVLYGAGGFLSQLLDVTELNRLNIAAVADSNPERRGRRFHGFLVVAPQDITGLAQDVVITSEAYEAEILDFLKRLFPAGEAAVHTIFLDLAQDKESV